MICCEYCVTGNLLGKIILLSVHAVCYLCSDHSSDLYANTGSVVVNNISKGNE